MKILKEVCEVSGEGLESLIGQNVMIFCPNYIYAGKLVGVNTADVKLEEAKIVYDTGAFNKPGYTDAQALPTKYHYVRTALIESYGIGK